MTNRGQAAARWWVGAPLLLGAGCGRTPGYDPQHPTEMTCGCDDPDTCYSTAAKIDHEQGETPETAETLLYYAQCACFEGSYAGCNTLGHYIRDAKRGCEANDADAEACTVLGFVYLHGVGLPQSAGASVKHDDAAADQAFRRACKAGAKVACDHVAAPPP